MLSGVHALGRERDGDSIVARRNEDYIKRLRSGHKFLRRKMGPVFEHDSFAWWICYRLKMGVGKRGSP